MRKLRGLGHIVVFLFMVACAKKTSSPVVATVDHAEITADEFQNRLADTPVEFRQYATTPSGRREFLNVLIREKVVLEAAQSAGIQHQPAFREAVSRYADQLKIRLQSYRDTLAVNSYLRKLSATELSATDREVMQYYERHRDNFEHPVEIQCSHILVDSASAADTVLKKIDGGEAFEKVAQELSQDPSTAALGGKLAPFLKGLGSGLKELEDASETLPVGEVSKPVQTAFGFHIIKKVSERKLPARSYDEAKEFIRARLEKQKFDQWVSAKQAALGVHINNDALASIASVTAASSQELSKNENP